MEVHKGFKNLSFRNPVVTMGIFDGVHRGHTVIIKRLIARATELNGESVIITFDPHPRLILEYGSKNLSILSTTEEKLALLKRTGADHLIVIEFDRQLSSLTAADFIKKILIDEIGMKHLIVGYDHHFGHKGSGDFETIKEFAKLFGFTVERIAGVEDDGLIISSSRIREALISRRLDEANRCLGYDYLLKGRVVEGMKLGRRLGFPTANIKPEDKFKLIPANGVYAVGVNINRQKYNAVLSIGFNPTVRKQPGERSIEAHIFDFEDDIYNEDLEIEFKFRLRDEMKFKDKKELAGQLKIDKENAIKLLT